MILTCNLFSNYNFNFSFFIALPASRGRICAPADARKQSKYFFIFYVKKCVFLHYLDNIELKCRIFYFRCIYFSGRIGLFVWNYGSFKVALGEARLNFAILEYYNA